MEELDYALVKVSCEALSAHFQRVRKHATRELAQVVAALNKPPTASDNTQQQPLSEEAAAGLRARLAALREALVRADAQEKEILARCHRKLLAIAQPAAGDATAAAASFQPRDGLDEAGRKQLERLIGEHLLRQGYFGALALLDSDPQAQIYDLDVFARIQEVAASLRDAHDCAPALAWCADHGSKLRRLGSVLEFRLHKQHFLDLVRRGERVPALEYAGQHLSPAALLQQQGQGQGQGQGQEGGQGGQQQEMLQQEVQQAMATLALQNPAECPVAEYARLFAPERWAELGDLFAGEAQRCYGLGGGVGTLEVVLQAGLTALKTPICTRCGNGGGRRRGEEEDEEEDDDAMDEEDEEEEEGEGQGDGGSGRATNCPVCHPAGRVLAAGLPFAHFNNSHLTCAHTGQRMDHENPPVALPNGRVYSRRAVHELLLVKDKEGEEGGEGEVPRVRCPRTGEIFPLSRARTIFII